jgi:hypothetical protein
MSRAYLCVSIDTLSDQAKGWRSRHPRSFEAITDGVIKRLHPLFERFGATPTYLLAPEVLGDAACVDTFRALAPSCELGTHLPYFEGDHEVERRELTALTDLFIRALDHQPQSFRAGRSGIGPASIGVLEALGYAVDASVTPHVDAFHDAPSQPYRPDPIAPGQPGESVLLEVPITIRRGFLQAIPGVGRRASARWLRPARRGTAASFVRVAEDEVAEARRLAPARPVILHATLANVEVVPWASPHGGDEEDARGILDRLRALLGFARGQGIAVVGLGDVPSILASSVA